MSPGDVVVDAGWVLHIKECPACEGGRGGVVCGHGNCDCPGRWEACERCEGEGVVMDEDCDCGRCMAAVAGLEAGHV